MSRKPKLDHRLLAMLRKGAKPTKPAKAKQPPLGPTPERAAKGDIVDGEHRVGTGERWKGARVVSTSPLDRYRRGGAITDIQDRSGKRLAADWKAGAGAAALIGSYGERESTASGEMTDTAAERHHAYVMAMQSLGPELSPVIVHVVLLDGSASGWAEARGRRGTGAKVEGMVTLRLALDRLARHYGLTSRGDPDTR